MRHNTGLLISGILHILIMAIPVSMAVVQNFNEVELFVMEEERPVIQQIKAVKHKMPEIVKVTKEEIKREEIPQKIEEEPVIKEEVIEPQIISHKPESIPMPPSVSSNPPVAYVHEVASGPPHDVEFGTAIGPKFLHRELPAYPMMARKFGREGKVVLRLTIDNRGNLLNVEVTQRAGSGFTEAAIEAVKRSTFLPAKKDGRTIDSRAILPIRFMLRGGLDD